MRVYIRWLRPSRPNLRLRFRCTQIHGALTATKRSLDRALRASTRPRGDGEDRNLRVISERSDDRGDGERAGAALDHFEIRAVVPAPFQHRLPFRRCALQ
eukprot:3671542-Rhodomonas_salina.1